MVSVFFVGGDDIISAGSLVIVNIRNDDFKANGILALQHRRTMYWQWVIFLKG